MKFASTRFGEIEVSEDQIYHFPDGLPGFNSKRFTFVACEGNPALEWMQSLDEPEVAVLTVDPQKLAVNYNARPKPGELKLIQPCDDGSEPLRYRVTVRHGADAGEALVNLFAPILLNPDRMLGMQVPLVGSGHTVREVWPPKPKGNVAD